MDGGISCVLAGTARYAFDYGVQVLPWLRSLPDACVHCVMTSPPYWGLRDYGVPGQIGLEKTPAEFVSALVEVFREVRRVLHPSGVLWLNMGDSYNSHPGQRKTTDKAGPKQETNIGSNTVGSRHVNWLKPKDLIGVPWLLAFALRDDGWYLRSDIIWHKPSPMPSSVTDRCTTAHEYLFMLTKSPRYFFDAEAIAEPATHAGKLVSLGSKSFSKGSATAMGVKPSGNGNADEYLVRETRNKRSVWTIAPRGYKGSHFAVFPRKLVEPCILAGTSAKGVCPTCGEPWRREMKKTRKPTRPGTDSKINRASSHETSPYHGQNGSVVGNRDPQRHTTVTETLGWRQGCKCEAADPVPALVMDPFLGSGTVVAVAVEHNRRAFGCDLNPEYQSLAEGRLASTTRSLFQGEA